MQNNMISKDLPYYFNSLSHNTLILVGLSSQMVGTLTLLFILYHVIDLLNIYVCG